MTAETVITDALAAGAFVGGTVALAWVWHAVATRYGRKAALAIDRADREAREREQTPRRSRIQAYGPVYRPLPADRSTLSDATDADLRRLDALVGTSPWA